MSVDELIDTEVKLYVTFCEKASKHDALEGFYKSVAHNLFYHIQELRSTGRSSALGKFTYPISK
jgi:hypothetical protein